MECGRKGACPHCAHSFYTEPELLVGVIPSGNVEADEASQEDDDFIAVDGIMKVKKSC